MENAPTIADGIRRGLALRCPTCGEGRLFERFLKVSRSCPVCGTDNTAYPSDDAPPYITVLIIGHVFLPLLLWLDRAWQPNLWLLFGVSLPMLAAMTVAALPFIKGAVVGIATATGVTRA